MPKQPLLIKFDEPIPATVRLPGIGGSVEGEVIAAEIQANGDAWILVKIPIWQRWHTQLKVGKPAVCGLGPAWTEMWCPAYAVETDNDRHDDIAERVRIAKAHAMTAQA
jgi:hypothetical protein